MTSRLFGFLLALCATLAAQDPRGAIIGRITDGSGAAVPGVEVKALNTATGVAAAARTNPSGNFSLPFLMPGIYTVGAELAGFRTYSREGVQLRVSEAVELNIALEVGLVTERIDVREQTPLLDTASSTLGQVVDARRILDLPVSGGNPVELAFLTPGVITNRSMIPMKAAFNGTAVSSDGAPAFTNEFQIDGISNTFADGTGRARDAFRPPATAIQEFRIQATPYDASVGHTMGAVITVSSASGPTSCTGGALLGQEQRLRRSQFLQQQEPDASRALPGQSLRRLRRRTGSPAQALQRGQPHLLVLRLGGQ